MVVDLLFYAIIGIMVLILLILIYYMNRIIVLSNRIGNAWAQIDVQLKKRNDLVPNLVEAVKGYMRHERGAIELVVSAREKMLGAQSPQEKAKASNVLTAALKTVFALAENYPTLKANENFLALQEQLTDLESKIAYSRQFYNDTILGYNNLIKTFPGIMFAGMLGKIEKPYLEVEEKERAVPQVKF